MTDGYTERGISRSYPFLSIAKKYNADYGLILQLADIFKHDRHKALAALDRPSRLMDDVQFAVDDFKRMQREGW